MSSARPSRMSPHVRRAFELLADGQWQEREVIVKEMSKVIPPGQAIRYQEKIRLLQRQKRIKLGQPYRPSADRRTQRSADYLVRIGRRAMALHSLNAARRVEREIREGVTWVRLRPPLRP